MSFAGLMLLPASLRPGSLVFRALAQTPVSLIAAMTRLAAATVLIVKTFQCYALEVRNLHDENRHTLYAPPSPSPPYIIMQHNNIVLAHGVQVSTELYL
jgi:hypothetical protein